MRGPLAHDTDFLLLEPYPHLVPDRPPSGRTASAPDRDELSIGSGGLDVVYDWWENHTIGLDTTIREGNARVFIPSDAQFRLHAETANGHISNDFSSKEDRMSGEPVKIDLSVGTDPNADLKVRALDGSINIKELYP